jgi:hypothetical protein
MNIIGKLVNLQIEVDVSTAAFCLHVIHILGMIYGVANRFLWCQRGWKQVRCAEQKCVMWQNLSSIR